MSDPRLWLLLGLPPVGVTVEGSALVYASIVGLLHLLVVAHFSRQEYGLKWIGSARDEPRPAMTGVGGRLERAYRNWLETFPIFIVAVAMVTLTGRSGAWSQWGAAAYLWGRLAYIFLYAAGVPVVRGLVWNVPTLGIMAMFASLFFAGGG